MNNYKYIEELLEKYWLGKTDLEEEKTLRDFFMQKQALPAHLQQYQPLFVYQQEESELRLPDDFEARLLEKIACSTSTINHQPSIILHRLSFFSKIAAGFILLIGIGYFGYQYNKTQEQRAARETVITALGMIADNLHEGETMIDEGLKQLEVLFKQ